ncbi:MAG: dihydrodipicolinate synthase family protein [Verrucomicrobia bacterium]|nr:dihydrodipicolinate synthase family protein [Verrucomicrobiota bacterium]
MNNLRNFLMEGHVIPALPLALNEDGSWSERHEKALMRYYFDAGAGGIAVGVHSTQFEIREPNVALFEPVLKVAIRVIEERRRTTGREFAAIAGVCGKTGQALKEAEFARNIGFDAALLSLAAFKNESEAEILKHCRDVSAIIPIIGFYLQPAVGGRVFSYSFWRAFMDIENVVAVKMAPFNRYLTWDVVRACIEAGREDIALYTGNDDNIVIDLLTPFEWKGKTRRISGGLLGHWGVWTNAAVQLFNELKTAREKPTLDSKWLTVNQHVTDMNAALFDSANGFKGCIPGIMEVLRRQGLVPSARTLNPKEVLSPGQAAELDRVCAAYPQLIDDAFISKNISTWLRE